MKKVSLILCGIFAVAIIPLLLPAAQETKTLKGEPVDIQCYLAGRSGAGHASCAATCVTEKGLPAGLVVEEDGKKVLYLLLGSGSTTAAKLVGEHMGKQVMVTGKVTKKEGLSVIQAEKVEVAE